MKNALLATVRHSLRILGYGAVGVLLTLVTVGVLYLNNRPDLSVWHTVYLDEEFTEDSEIASFAEYLQLENRLFDQLDREIYAVVEPTPAPDLNRYSKGSLADPARWAPNWNRSFEKTVVSPRAAVLLLHGLSDSPYSIRHVADALHAHGSHVLGLRIPGHGTAPSGLVRAEWQDMAAAVRLAMRHLAEENPGIPLYMVGYSNGAALALNYELDSLADPTLPGADRLVLLSPEIAVTSLARFARSQSRLGRLLGLEKLAWNEILPEYDPFKYGSFAVNAGRISYELTRHVQDQITHLTESGKISAVSPILAFSSVVDATVQVDALFGQLFDRLQPGGHELVLFDINRRSGIEQLLRLDPKTLVEARAGQSTQHYVLSLVTNQEPYSSAVAAMTWLPAAETPDSMPLGMDWPADLFSLTHVALPFPAEDTLYGGRPAGESPGIQLGALAYRGERGVLKISADAMLRLRWNPFYPYLESRTLEFFGLDGQN